MTDFLERLPWRLGAVAGLLVGAVSLIAGAGTGATLLRVGAAFLIFFGLGVALRTLMGRGSPSAPTPPASAPNAAQDDAGSHVDQKTPEMTVDDL